MATSAPPNSPSSDTTGLDELWRASWLSRLAKTKHDDEDYSSVSDHGPQNASKGPAKEARAGSRSVHTDEHPEPQDRATSNANTLAPPYDLNTRSSHYAPSLQISATDYSEVDDIMSDNLDPQHRDKDGFWKRLMQKRDKGTAKVNVDDATENKLYKNEEMIDKAREGTGEDIDEHLEQLSLAEDEDADSGEDVAKGAVGAAKKNKKKKKKSKKGKKAKKAGGEESEQPATPIEEPVELSFEQRSALRQAAHKKRREDAARANYIARHGGIVAQGKAELIDIGPDGRRVRTPTVPVSSTSSVLAHVGVPTDSDSAAASPSTADGDDDNDDSDDSADTLTKVARMGIVVPDPSAEELRRRWSVVLSRVLTCIARFDLIEERLTQLEKDANAATTVSQLRDVSACVSRLTTETAEQGDRGLAAIRMTQCYNDMHEEVNEMVAKKHAVVRRLVALSAELRIRIITGASEEEQVGEVGKN